MNIWKKITGCFCGPEWRARMRGVDSDVLWNSLWREAGNDISRFLFAAWQHAEVDPAWRKPEEWKGGPEDPEVWVKMRWLWENKEGE